MNGEAHMNGGSAQRVRSQYNVPLLFHSIRPMLSVDIHTDRSSPKTDPSDNQYGQGS